MIPRQQDSHAPATAAPLRPHRGEEAGETQQAEKADTRKGPWPAAGPAGRRPAAAEKTESDKAQAAPRQKINDSESAPDQTRWPGQPAKMAGKMTGA